MANQGRLRFGIDFNVDKSGLNDLKSALANLQNTTKLDVFDASTTKKEIKEIQESAQKVQAALNKSYNTKLGTYNLEAFKKELNNTTGGLQTLQKQWSKVASGERAFRNLADALTSTNLELKETHSLLDSMGTTLMNTIKWSIASNAVNTVTGSIQKAWSFTKQLDESLTNIMIVTEKSSDQMAAFARQANTAAKALGASTKAYTDAALIYYQQGLSDQDVAARTDVTIKAANVTGQSASAVSEQLTAVWNGYKVSAQEAELYVDKLSAVAATTAADLEELSVGMSKVASAANTMGVDIDQLNGQLATVISVTRQAPESVGTAFKTIYARMGDIESGLDVETTLGEYTSQMAEMGFNVLTANGKLRDMGEVIEEIGSKWKTLSREQQVALSQTMAGTRQYNNLLALFDNWDMYTKSLQTSASAAGTLTQQNEEYLDSLEAKMQKLTTTAEDLYLTLFDSDSFKSVIDLLTKGVDTVGQFAEALGGGGTILLSLGTILTRVFSKQIAQSISTTASNIINMKQNAQSLSTTLNNIKEISKLEDLDEATKRIIKLKEQLVLLRQAGLITNEEFEELSKSIGDVKEAADEASRINERQNERQNILNKNKIYNERKEANKKGVVGVRRPVALADIEEEASKTNNYEDIDKNVKYQKFKAQLDEFTISANKTPIAVESFEEAFNQINLENPEKNLEEFNEALAQLVEDELKARQSGFLDPTTADEYGKALQALREDGNDYKLALEDLIKKEKELKAAQKRNKAAGGQDEDYINQEASAQKAYEEQLAKVQKKEKDIQEQRLNSIRFHNKKVKTEINNATKDLEQGAKDAAAGVKKQADNTVDQVVSKVQNGFKRIDLTKSIKQVTDFISTLGMVASAISVVQNIGSIWDNEDLSTGEKILQTVINLSSALGMLTPAMIAVSGWINGLTASYMANGVAIIGNVAATKFLEANKKSLSKEAYKAAAAEITETGALSANTVASIANAAGQKLAGAGIKTTTAAIRAQTAALLANPMTWIVVGLVVAIGALVAVVGALTKAYNADNLAAQRAAETAQKLQQAYSDTKAAYEDLKKSIEDYHAAQDALDEMITGTEEWRDAIAEANQQVLELINTYPELAKYLNNEGGKLTLDEEGLTALEAEKKADVGAALREATLGQQSSNEASFKAQRTSVKRQASYQDLNSSMEYIGKSATALWPLIEGIVKGDTMAAAKDEATDEQMEELVEILSKNTEALTSKEAFVDALKGTGLENASSALIDSLWNNRNSLQELVTSNHQLEAENAALRQTIAQSWLQENQVYQDLITKYAELEKEEAKIDKDDVAARTEIEQQKAEVQQDINALNTLYSSDAFQSKKKADIKADIEETIDSSKNFMTDQQTIEARKELVKEYYSKSLGVPASDIKVTNSGGNSYTIEYIGVDPEKSFEKKKGLDYADLAENLANQRLADQGISEEDAQKVLDKFNALSDIQQAAYQTFIGDASGDFSKMSAEEMKSIKKKWENKDLDELSSSERKELEQLAEALGYDTTDESLTSLLEGFQEGIKNYNLEEKNIKGLFVDDFDRIIGTVFTSTEWNNFSQVAQKEFAMLWNDLAVAQGDAGEAAAEAFLGAMGDNTALIQTALKDVNWADEESIEAFKENMASLKIDDEIVDNFVIQMQKMNGTFESFNLKKAEEAHATLQKVVNGLNNIGDTISAEDYNLLDDNLQSYFVRMADGTYALTKSAEEFRKVAKDAEEAVLKEKFLQGQATIKEQKNVTVTETQKKAALEEAGLLDDVEERNKISAGKEILDKINKYSYSESTQDVIIGQLTDEEKDSVATALGYGSSDNPLFEYLLSTGGLNEVAGSHIVQWAIDSRLADANEKAAAGDALIADLEKAQEAENVKITAEQFEKNKEIISQGFALQTNVNDLTSMAKDWGLMDAKGNWYEDVVDDEVIAEYEKRQEYLQALAKDFKIEVDPFELINNELDITERKLSKLSKEFDNLVGTEAINNLTEQNKLLDEQIKKTQEKINLAKEEADEDKTEIEKMAEQVGIDVEYDDNGNITNIQEIADAATTHWQENYDSVKAEEYEKNFNEVIDSYGTYINQTIPDLIEENEDRELQKLKNNLTKLDLSLEQMLKPEDAKRSVRSFYEELAVEENDYDKRAQNRKADIESYLLDVQDYRTQLTTLELTSVTAADKQAKIEEWNAAIQESILAAKQAQEQIQQEMLDNLDAINAAYDEQISALEQITNLLDYQFQLQELVYGEEFDQSDRYSSQLKMLNEQKAVLTDELNQYKVTVDEDTNRVTSLIFNDVNMDLNSEEGKAALANWTAANEEMANISFETAKTIIEYWRYAVDTELKDTLKLEEFKKEWDWLQNEAEKYYDIIDRSYQLSKLESEFNKAIDNTSSLAIQKEIAELRDRQLAALKAQSELSERDVKLARARLEILQAEIALRDAQENKTSMRLVRGANGTYGYQYTADLGAIEEAQQKKEDAKNSYVNTFKDDFQGSIDDFQSAQEAWAEYYAQAVADGSLSPEEKERLAELQESVEKAQAETKDYINNFTSNMREMGYSEDEINAVLESAGVNSKLGQRAMSDSTIKDMERLTNLNFADFITDDSFTKEDLEAAIQAAGLEGFTANAIAGYYTQKDTAKAEAEELKTTFKDVADAATQVASSLSILYAAAKEASIALLVAGGLSQTEANAEVSGLNWEYTASSTAPTEDDEESSAASGGYTGEWGPEGRKMWVHEKELILKKEDTENFLKALTVVRDLNIQSLGAISAGSAESIINHLMKTMQIDQNVQISAEFPNATNKEEIIEAFNELINIASQKIYEQKND